MNTTVASKYGVKGWKPALLTSEYLLGSVDGAINAGSFAPTLPSYRPHRISSEIMDSAALERIHSGDILARSTWRRFISAALGYKDHGLTAFLPLIVSDLLHSA